MTIDGRYFERAFREAEQQEIIGGDSLIISGLRDVLTPELTKQGLSIDFGDDRHLASKTLDFLKIEEMLHANKPSIHLHQAVVLTPGVTSYIGRALPELGELSLLDAVDALQADRWEADNEHGSYYKVRVADDVVNSRLVIANSTIIDGEKAADLTKPGVEVGAVVRYTPQFDDEDLYGPHVPTFIGEVQQGGRRRETTVQKLAIEMASGGLELMMPSANYYLSFGEFSHGRLGTIGGVLVRNEFTIEAGQVVPKPDRFGA